MKKLIRIMSISVTVAMLFTSVIACSNKTSDTKNTAVATDAPEKTLNLLWTPAVASATAAFPTDDAFVIQEMNKMFNVKIKVQPTYYGDQQKMGIMFASGTIPDVNIIQPPHFDTYNSQGLFREIPLDMIKKYAPTLYKRTSALQDYNKMPANINGKIYGLPHTTVNPGVLGAIRTDWLQKVGAKVPTTLAEFENVAKLFAENDPDGNGKKDTYLLGWGPAIQMNLDFIKAAFNLSNMVMQDVGVVSKPSDYLLGSDGKLTDPFISENYKQFLKYLQNLYKKGYVYPDLTQTKADNVKNLFANGQVGFTVDTYTWFLSKYRPTAYFAQTFAKNPNAKTEYIKPLKTIDGKDSQFLNIAGIWAYTTFGKNTTDDQVIRVLKIYEKQQTDLTFHNLIWRGIEGKHFTVDPEGMAVYTKEYESLDAQTKDGLKLFFVNVREGKEMTLSFGKDSEVQFDFIAKNYQPVINPYIISGTVIQNQKDLGTDINKVTEEFFIKAFSGAVDIDAEWSAYVARVKKAGSDKVLEEVNKIYQDQKSKK